MHVFLVRWPVGASDGDLAAAAGDENLALIASCKFGLPELERCLAHGVTAADDYDDGRSRFPSQCKGRRWKGGAQDRRLVEGSNRRSAGRLDEESMVVCSGTIEGGATCMSHGNTGSAVCSGDSPAKVRMDETQSSSCMTTLTTPPRNSWAKARSKHSRLTLVEPSDEAIDEMLSSARISASPGGGRLSLAQACESDNAREAAPCVSHAMTGAKGRRGRRISGRLFSLTEQTAAESNAWLARRTLQSRLCKSAKYAGKQAAAADRAHNACEVRDAVRLKLLLELENDRRIALND